MNDMNTALPTTMPPPIPSAVQFTERDQFDLDLRKAKVFAASTLVPAQYQDNIPNCLIALNMAKRIGMDPLMCTQNLHVVQGKPGWSGQFLIAAFNQCGRFTAMRFEWRGDAVSKTEWGCRAYATERQTGEKIVGAWVTWKMVEGEGWSKKNGSKWLTMPEQMFMYRAAAFLVRTHAPEIAMGLQTIEEIADVIDITPSGNGSAATSKVDAIKAVLRERIEEPAAAITQAEPTEVAVAKAKVDEAREQLMKEAVPPPTYAELAAAINRSVTADDVNDALSLIDKDFDKKQKVELADLAKARILELNA